MYKDRIGKNISVNEVSAGWASIIREFGLFSPLEPTISDVYTGLARTSDNSQEISRLVGEIVNIRNFSNYVVIDGELRDVVCPAIKVVPLVVLNAALNLSLVKYNQFSEETFVPLIQSTPPNRFLTEKQMMAMYDEVLS